MRKFTSLVALIWAAAALAQSPSVPASSKGASGKGDRELGEYLSSQCTGCHQISGRSTGAVPAIIGWPADQFVAVLLSYKEGTRENETMRTISHRLSTDDIEALAAYFGSLVPAPR